MDYINHQKARQTILNCGRRVCISCNTDIIDIIIVSFRSDSGS